VIVNWNTKAYLLQCLESIEKQKSAYRVEIVVVDNDSSDGSAEAVEKRFPHVRVIRTGDNLGFARANNIGIRESGGEYVCLVNSDVEMLPDCLARLNEFMDADHAIGLCGPRLLNRDLSVQYSCRHFPTLGRLVCDALKLSRLFPSVRVFSGEEMKHFAYESACEVDALSGAFLVARREAVAGVGLLDEGFFMYSEDVDWCRRFHEAGWKVAFFPGSEAVHFGGASSAADPAAYGVEKERAVLRYWRKYHSRPSFHFLRLVRSLHHVLRLVSSAVQYVVRPSYRRGIAPRFTGHSACLRCVLGKQP
jgi:hypothetical protein